MRLTTGGTPAGTGFTYQGQLKYRNAPANGAFDFEFRLYDAVAGGTPIGVPVAREDVTVTNGLFMVPKIIE